MNLKPELTGRRDVADAVTQKDAAVASNGPNLNRKILKIVRGRRLSQEDLGSNCNVTYGKLIDDEITFGKYRQSNRNLSLIHI